MNPVLIALMTVFTIHQGSSLSLPCLEDSYVDSKLSNQGYVRAAIACMMNPSQQCPDKMAENVRHVAPQVLRNSCVRPCTPCIKKQVQKTISFMQNNYPQEFGIIVNKMLQDRNQRRPFHG